MDPLSDLLRVVRLDGAYFYAVEGAGPWSIEALPATDLTPRILPDAEHLISYHILTEGRCWGGLAGGPPIGLEPGDVIVFPHGDSHFMASGPGARPGGGYRVANPRRYRETVRLGSGGERNAAFVCGFLGCDRRPFNPLLTTLPRVLHVRGLSRGWLAAFSERVVQESSADRAGSDCVLTRLAELMFIEVLRRHLEALAPDQTGWLAGLRDPIVGKALGLLHTRPGYGWTLDQLVAEVAASRSKFVERFTSLVGQPPMQYLTRWRMQVAAGLLLTGSAKVAAVAGEVGYDSEAAFSRAFKKATGVSPGSWRGARTRQAPPQPVATSA